MKVSVDATDDENRERSRSPRSPSRASTCSQITKVSNESNRTRFSKCKPVDSPRRSSSPSPSAVAEEDEENEDVVYRKSATKYNEREDVGGLPIANYCNVAKNGEYWAFEDLLDGPATIATLQGVHPDWLKNNQSTGGLIFAMCEADPSMVVVCKQSRCQACKLETFFELRTSSGRGDGAPNDLVLFSALVATVTLNVPFCQSSRMGVMTCDMASGMQDSDFTRDMAEEILTNIIAFNVRIVGGRFGSNVMWLITKLRNLGLPIQIAAWLPCLAGALLCASESMVLIVGRNEDGIALMNSLVNLLIIDMV